jgi:hypothetical protein
MARHLVKFIISADSVAKEYSQKSYRSAQNIIEEIPEYMDLDAKVSLNFTELMKITCWNKLKV